MESKQEGEKGLFSFPVPDGWLHRANTCEKRALQGQPRTQIVRGCLGDCILSLCSDYLPLHTSKAGSEERGLHLQVFHGKGHLASIQETLKVKSENEGREKIEA